jgi:flagellar biosynthesis protein FlhA
MKESLQRENGELGVLTLPPETTRAMFDSLEGILRGARKKKRQPVVVCLPVLRRHLRRLWKSQWRDLGVLSFAEIPDSVEIDVIGLIAIPGNAGKKDAT